MAKQLTNYEQALHPLLDAINKSNRDYLYSFFTAGKFGRIDRMEALRECLFCIKVWLTWIDIQGYMYEREHWYAPCLPGPTEVADLPEVNSNDVAISIDCNTAEHVFDIRTLDTQFLNWTIQLTEVPSQGTAFAHSSGKIIFLPPADVNGVFTATVSCKTIYDETYIFTITYTINECPPPDLEGAVLPTSELGGQIINL